MYIYAQLAQDWLDEVKARAAVEDTLRVVSAEIVSITQQVLHPHSLDTDQTTNQNQGHQEKEMEEEP